ncbi:MAG: BatD family protein [Pseudolabrys sp.]
MRRICLALIVLIGAAPAEAQQSTLEPTIRVSIDPAKTVVGQSVTLQIDVLAPNYMTKPAVMPDFQLRNAVTRAASTINMSEQRDGVTYAGVRYEFLIYPQEPGAYAIADQTITVTYAADPPNVREAAVPVPRIAFEAFIPDPAQTLDPFVSATTITLRQEVQSSPQPLKVGDAVTRTVTIEAQGTPAMLLPPTGFAAVSGTTIYPAQPELHDRSDRRTDVLSSTRTDQATYMLEQAGDVTLPAVELRWWNARAQKIESAHADSVTLHVVENPALKGTASSPDETVPVIRRAILFLIDHWRVTLALIVALGALALLGPRMLRDGRSWIARRHDAYRLSEARAFADLRATARHGDAGATYSAMLHWLLRFEPAAPAHTIGALKAAARDHALDREIERIEHHLYARQKADAAWSAKGLLNQLRRARSKLQQQRSQRKTVLPAEINPRTAYRPASPRLRPVAR